jgi:glycosyltransferase involved in cell wall biosynthesis
MNRATWTTSEPAPPQEQLLPPRQRAGPARILFLHGAELGFSTTARNLERFTATRDDIDAVHIRVPWTGWHRHLTRAAPLNLFHLDQPEFRTIWTMERLVLRALRQARPDHFDVIHFMTQQRSRAILKLRSRTSAKLVVNADATTPAYTAQFGWNIPKWSLVWRVERTVLNAADMVACASRWVGDSAARDEGVDPGRIILHKPCAVRDATMPARKHDESPIRGTPGGEPVRIAFVGNDWERKGGPRLVAWHQKHFKDRAELHVCSGKAPQDQSLARVIWHGATAHDKLMREILPTCDMFVMPTRNDTFLIAAQEAQAVGLPVVTSRMAGIPEVVRHGRTGFLQEPEDDAGFVASISKLIDDHALRRRMGAAALEHAGRNLSGEIWHNHLLTQLVNLADARPLKFAPEGVDVRRSDEEANNPASEVESLAAP